MRQRLCSSSLGHQLCPSLHLCCAGPGKVVRATTGAMNYLDDLLPVLLGTARIAFKARTSEDGGAREGGGSEGRGVCRGAEGVKDIVGKKEEESFGGGSLRPSWTEYQPARVDRSRVVGGHLEENTFREGIGLLERRCRCWSDTRGLWELCVPDMHPKPTPFSQVSAYHVLSPHYDAFPTSRCVAQPRSAGYRVRGLHGLHRLFCGCTLGLYGLAISQG